MRFLFLPAGCLPFHGKTLEERPIGGTETGVIRLAEALAEHGHEVTVVSEYENPPLTQALYIPSRSMQFIGQVDVLIGVRDWRMCLLPIQAKKRFFLTGDAADQPVSVGFGDTRVARRIDGFLAVSDWHAKTMCASSGFPQEKAHVIRNGVHLPYFEGNEEKTSKRLIYSSTPYRGLALLPEIFREIGRRHPDASLHVFSDYTVYAGTQPIPQNQLEEFARIKQELSLPNVFFHGNVLQKELAREFMKSSILAYPNTFAETSCITALEAQAAGCVPVTSSLGALPETVADSGVLINERPGTDAYKKSFIDAVDGLFSNPESLHNFAQRGLNRSKSYGWDTVARTLLSITESTLNAAAK